MPGPEYYKGKGSDVVLDDAFDVTSENGLQNKVISEALAGGANYAQPSASLTNVSQVVEVGTVLPSVNLNVGFNQNDAGAATAYRIEQDGQVIANSAAHTVINLEAILGNIQFRGFVDHAAGPVKENDLGIEDTAGQIQAGTVQTPVRTITGKLKIFFASAASIPSNSAEVRSLANNVYADQNTISFLASAVNNILVVPESKTLQSVVTANNETLTGNFSMSTLTVADAKGVLRTYRLYQQTSALPLNVVLTATFS
ncbi:hypothetical protein [Mesonia mobilis]|uniref:hypothetical protein n=1 Tax=Mesonia mobilis TaxID=369791 RepID=UPI0026F1A1C4|nr:hypothetical protein [Mesonia mobilis]